MGGVLKHRKTGHVGILKQPLQYGEKKRGSEREMVIEREREGGGGGGGSYT